MQNTYNRYALAILLSIVINTVFAQTSPQPNYTLVDNQSGTEKSYVARDYVSLKPGFTYSATSGKTFSAKIDAGLLFPPTDKTYKKTDGSFTNDPTQGAVVGSIPGQFAVSPTGAATYTIPIEVPAGINGMQPQVSLVYNSQGGNGIAGWGWNLSGMSMISRTTKTYYYDNEKSGIIWDNTTPLTLDGERLIEIQRWNTDSVEYKTQAESYSRIIGYNILDWGPSYFKVYTKSGQTIQYGNYDNIASYFPLEKNTSGFIYNLSWAIASVTDNNGNYINYTYKNDATTFSFMGLFTKTTYKNTVLDKITYGGNSIANTTANQIIQFVYNNTNVTNLTDNYIDGKNNYSNIILDAIKVKSNGSEIRKYITTYNVYDSKSHLINVSLSNDKNEYLDPLSFDWSNNVYQYNYQGTVTYQLSASQLINQYQNNDGYNNRLWTMGRTFGDFDGDGDMDVIIKYNLEKKYFKNDWDKFWENWSYDYKYVWVAYRNDGGYYSFVYNQDWDYQNESNFMFLDKNNDGLDELYIGHYYNPLGQPATYGSHYKLCCYEYQNSILVRSSSKDISLDNKNSEQINNPTTIVPADYLGQGEPQFLRFITIDGVSTLYNFSANNSNYTIPCSSSGETYISDYNGNGKSELVYLDEDLKIYEFVKNATNNLELKLMYTLQNQGVDHFDKIFIGDFNGDGNTDFLIQDYPSYSWRFFISNGNALFEATMNNTLTTSSSVFVTDVNKDGKSDILFYDYDSNNRYFKLLVGNGSGFEQVFSQNHSGSFITAFDNYGRFNNDKYNDILLSYAFNSELIGVSNNVIFDKIIKCRDSFSNSTNVSYDLFNSNKIKVVENGLNRDFSKLDVRSSAYGSWDVVNAVTTQTSGNDIVSNVSYLFEDAIIHKKGKGFLGYLTTETTDNINLIVSTSKNSVTDYNNTFYYLYPQSTTIKSTNGTAISYDSVYYPFKPFYIAQNLGNNTYRYHGFYKLEPKLQYSKDNLTNLTSTTEYISYDEWGNPTSIKSTKGEMIETNTINYIQKGAWCPNKTLNILIEKKYQGVSNQHSSKVEYSYDPKGNLTSETRSFIPADEKFKVITEYENFDNFGHARTIKLKAKDKDEVERTRTSYVTYTPSGRFIASKTNVLGETTYYDWGDEKQGKLQSETFNNKTTTYTYDNWGALKETRYPDGNRITEILQWAGLNAVNGAKYYKYSQASASAPITVWYDGLGRELQKDTYGLDNNKKISVSTEYYTTGINKGKLHRVSEPYFEGESKTWAATYNAYDPYGRGATSIQTSMGTSTTTFSGLSTTMSTPEGSQTTTLNSSGLTESNTINEKTVNYTYYPNRLTKTVTPSGGQTLSMEYDVHGNRTRLIDPDAGEIISLYNGFDELVEEKQKIHIDNTNYIVTTNNYDPLTGLLTSIVRNGETTSYTYNASNKRRVDSIAIAGKNTQTFEFDDFDRVIKITENIIANGTTKTFVRSKVYDALGRLKKEIYPSGYYTINTFDDYSNLISIKDKGGNQIWEAVAENARGQLTDVKKGGRLIKHSFDKRGLPTTIKSDNIIDLEYNFDDKLNLKYRIDKHLNSQGSLIAHREDFEYDPLNRLYQWAITQTGATTTSKTTEIVYNNVTGTITSKSDLGNYTFGYGEDNGKPHALTSISGVPDNFPQQTEAYPLANLDVTYTDFKKIKTLSEMGKTYELTYGVEDQRRKSEYKVNGVTQQTRYYFGDYEEEIDNLGNVKQIHYLSGAIMIRENGVETLYYAYTDYQGSLLALTDANGTVVERYAYDPWGARRNPDDWTQKDSRTIWIVARGYTGHEHLDQFGIINMNGRVYDPLTAQFFSPDPFIQSPGNWLNYNRYGYCFGNPFRYTDPSGYKFWDPFIFLAKIVVNTVVTVVAAAVGLSITFGGFYVGALIGNVPGAIIGGGVGLYLGVQAAAWILETLWWE